MIKWLKNIFKKKTIEEEITPPKPKKLKMDDVNFSVNIKSICYFESLVDKSFFEMAPEDVIDMLYSIYMVNNVNKPLKREVFINVLGREDVFRWMIKKYMEASEIWSQFHMDNDVIEMDNNTQNEVRKIRVSDYASTLIIEHNLDPHYVFYEMDLWEIKTLFEAIDTKNKKELVDKRFWAYLGMTPHIDTKKCKSPEELIPFEWEKELKKINREQELKNNTYAVKHMIGKSIFGDKDGK